MTEGGTTSGGEPVASGFGAHVEGSAATSLPPPPTQSAIPAAPEPASRPSEHKPLAMRARVASALVLLVTLIEFVTVPLAVFDYQLYGRVIAGEELSATTWDRVDQVWHVLAVASIITFLLSAVAVVAWFHQAYKNLSTYSFVDHRPGWAIGAWFVPFLNLYRPFKIMGELFRRSGLNARQGGEPALNVWWALFVAGYIAGRVIGGMPLETPADAQASDIVTIVIAIAGIVEGVLLLWLIRTITWDQDERLAQPSDRTPAFHSPETSAM